MLPTGDVEAVVEQIKAVIDGQQRDCSESSENSIHRLFYTPLGIYRWLNLCRTML